MGAINISQAMRSIKDEKCCKCGNKAKGLIYRERVLSYYCKKCLRKYTDQSDRRVKMAASAA